ncbi:unnamed protein product [Schistosoma haematobium]|nr:unnamed protein product [Schistosoma haematobium]
MTAYNDICFIQRVIFGFIFSVTLWCVLLCRHKQYIALVSNRMSGRRSSRRPRRKEWEQKAIRMEMQEHLSLRRLADICKRNIQV